MKLTTSKRITSKTAVLLLTTIFLYCAYNNSNKPSQTTKDSVQQTKAEPNSANVTQPQEAAKPNPETPKAPEPKSEEPKANTPDVEGELKRKIERESNGCMTLASFQTSTSRQMTMYGSTMYEYKGTLRVKVLKDCYKTGDAIGGFFQDFKCYTSGGSGNTYYRTVQKYDAGQTLQMDKTITFEKYDQGWKFGRMQ